MILFVVCISFVCTTVLLTELEPDPDVCDLVKRPVDCNFIFKGE